MSRKHTNPTFTLAPSHGPADALRLLARAYKAGASPEELAACAAQVNDRACAAAAKVEAACRPHLAERAADAWRKANTVWRAAVLSAEKVEREASAIFAPAPAPAASTTESKPAGRPKGPKDDSMLGRAIAQLKEARAAYSVPWLWAAIAEHFPSPGKTPMATLSAALLRASRQGLVRRAGRGLWEAL